VGCFVANLALRRGLLSTRQLLLETEDAVTQGDGRLDFRNERVEIRLRTQSRHLTVGVLPAPLLISGSLKEASARPDPAAHGGVSEILAALPTVQLGTGDGSRCRQALDHKRG
jgi:hypothetical protein